MSGSNRRTLIGYSIIVVLFGVAILRACIQSVTHDEALTYLLFVSEGWNTVWLRRPSSNNHTLNSLLMWGSTTLLGLSHLTLRAPALLGGLIYLVACERLCRKRLQNERVALLTLLVMTANPFVLDYLVAARGYGLALGFLVSALLLSLEPRRRWSYCRVSVLCALSVASNLAFAIVNASLLGVVLAALWLRNRSFQKRWDTLALIVPGALLYLALNPAVFRLNPDTLYFGSSSWVATAKSLVDALFDDFAPQALGLLWSGPVIAGLGGLLALLAVIGLLHLVAIPWRQSIDPSILIASILIATILGHTLLYWTTGTLLPSERTGLYFVPLGVLLLGMAVDRFSVARFEWGVRRFGEAGLAMMTLYFLCCFRTDYFREWKYDAGSSEASKIIGMFDPAATGGAIGIDWRFRPSLAFYSRFYQRFSHRLLPKEDPRCSAWLLMENDPLIRDRALKTLYFDPLSKAVLVVK